MRIPHAENATVAIRKLRDYRLNPKHPEGKHKALLFVAALGMTEADAEPLRDALLQVVKSHDATLNGAMPTSNVLLHGRHLSGGLFFANRIR